MSQRMVEKDADQTLSAQLAAARARFERDKAQDSSDHRKIDGMSPQKPKDHKQKPKAKKIERPMTGIVIPKDAPRWLAERIEKRTKRNVRERSYQARLRGKISATACQSCGVTADKAKLELHHDDYSKHDVVRVFCRSCHRKHHWDRGEIAE